MPESSRQFLLGGFEALGYSGSDVEETIKKGLPQFKQFQGTGFIR